MLAILPPGVFRMLVNCCLQAEKGRQRNCRLLGTNTEVASTETSPFEKLPSLSLLCTIVHEVLLFSSNMLMNS